MAGHLPNLPRFRRLPRQIPAAVEDGQDMHLLQLYKINDPVPLEEEFGTSSRSLASGTRRPSLG